MKPQVPEKVRKSRLSELIEVQNQITRERNQELVGTTQEVLVLGKGKRDVPTSDGSEVNSWYGKTRQHKTVVIDGDMRPGDFVQVKIEGIRGWTAWGKYGSM
jgi:tRNA-2-methylthio-N6-dimethylallyladenosine synthase